MLLANRLKCFFLILFTAAILVVAPFSVLAINEVTINGIVNFEILTADTAVLTTLLASAGGQITLLDVQSNYIDITLDNLSTITFNTTAPSLYIRIAKQSGSNDYTVTPTCPTTTATINGTGATVVLRLQVYTTNICPSAGGGHGFIFPTNYSVLINNGAATTTSTNVSLKLQAQNADWVIVSNDPNFYGANWQTFTTPKIMNWGLETGAGLKTIYVIYKSSDGNMTPIISDTIELITEIPSEEIPPEEMPPSGTCIFDCQKVTYDLYIVNPDGTQRSMNNGYAKIIELGNEVRIIGFEDKGTDFDFNDVIIKVDKSDCNHIIVTVLSHDAGWRHKIKIKLYYSGILKEDLILYEDSHLAEFQEPKTINLVQYSDSCQSGKELSFGDLLKGSQDTIYYYALDGKRYIFPDSKTYFSWFSDFKKLKKVSDEILSTIPFGKNITHRPGVRMVKLTTDPKVYAVDLHGTLRWIENERVAISLYGPLWQTYIDDVSDAFFSDYKFGDTIFSLNDFNPSQRVALTYDIDTDLGLK